jgi:hypothetical protein
VSFTAPLGLLALLAVPAVVALHRFRRRLAERRVAALFLFEAALLQAGPGRTRTRLLRSPSLWLELLAATLLALWLGGLSFGGAASRHLVVVLDDSASMSARGVAERALRVLRDELAGLGSGAFATLLRTGPRPELVVGPQARPAEVAAALAGYRPQRTAHDVQPTLELARELAGAGGEVWFVTDQAPLPGGDDLHWLAFGASATNAALLTVARRPATSGEGEVVHASIAAFGAAMATTTLTVRAGNQELGTLPVTFADGRADVTLPLPAGVDVVELRLRPDAMPLDDVAWLLPPPRREVAISVQVAPELAASLAVEDLLAVLPEVRREPDAAQAQLLLRDRPGPLAEGQLEVLVHPGTGKQQAFQAPFVVDRAAPWLAGVTLHGVVWAAGELELPGRVLIAAGPNALASEAELEVGRRLWLRLDASVGNLVRAPDWPVLWTNLVEACRPAVPGAVERHLPVGGEALYRRLPSRGSEGLPWCWITPEGAATAVTVAPATTWVAHVLHEPGVHRLQHADGTELARFAARFVDPAESDLRHAVTQRVAPTATAARDGAVVRDPGTERRWLAMLLVLCVLLDWWVLARRAD